MLDTRTTMAKHTKSAAVLVAVIVALAVFVELLV